MKTSPFRTCGRGSTHCSFADEEMPQKELTWPAEKAITGTVDMLSSGFQGFPLTWFRWDLNYAND
jgi:hypothetical protein